MAYMWCLLAIVVVFVSLGAWFWRPKRTILRAMPLVRAKQRFHAQRERLEAKFVQLAAAHVGPNAPRLADCSFDDDVAYVRSRATGELSAFVAVTIATVEPASVAGDSNAPADNLQAGTAVFRFDRDHWETDGRAILNLSPIEAVHHFSDDFEIISEDFAHRA